VKRVAIVGAGIVGTTLAYHLVKAGHQVDLFENGGETPYPHLPQFEAEVLYSNHFAPPVPTFPAKLPDGIKGLVQSGDYGQSFNDERIMTVGGQATQWFGITPRFQRENFRSRTLHGFGLDWPISYEDIEPYYCLAERHLGISGNGKDNPFASPRSEPYPLPPFELGYKDNILAEKLRSAGIVTHTTPQARVRHDFDDRPGCQNFGACGTCPIGARYSPNHHIEKIRDSKAFRLHTNSLVRRIIIENGRGRGVAYHPDHGRRQVEHRADAVILTAGAVESARLLLLSKGTGIHSDGIGNASGQVGRNFGTHHVWWGELTFAEPMLPGRAGPPTLLTHQFALPKEKGRHGGSTIELFDGFPLGSIDRERSKPHLNGAAALKALRPTIHKRALTMNAEMVPGPGKYVALSDSRDRFGDPFAALTYRFDDFDHATHARNDAIANRIMRAAGASDFRMPPIGQFWTAHHHLGTCRMGTSARDSVVDSFGAVHDTPGLYVCGGSTFVTVTPMQPTLTMVALAIRSAARIAEDLGA
jgi:glucose dehydrogenase